MLSRNDFKERIQALLTISSKTGRVTYSEFTHTGDVICFKRDSTENFRKLSVSDLYEAYENLAYIDTNSVKPFIKGWKYSPACAILIAIGMYNQQGQRIFN